MGTAAPILLRAGESQLERRRRQAKLNLKKLLGQWQRPDGGYVLAIKSIAADGLIGAGYFNPGPIHVAKAEASHDGEAAKGLIKLGYFERENQIFPDTAR